LRHSPPSKKFYVPLLNVKCSQFIFSFCHLDFSKPIPILFRSTSMVALANARASCLIGQGYFTFHYILYLLFLFIYLIHCENVYFVYFTLIHSQICNTPISFLTVNHIYIYTVMFRVTKTTTKVTCSLHVDLLPCAR
jgi:hypothetical protein